MFEANNSSEDEATRMISVAQLGARMHYAVPQILNGSDKLARLFTDLTVDQGAMKLCNLIPKSIRPSGLQRLLGRSTLLSPDRVTAFTVFGLKYHFRLAACKTEQQKLETYLWAGKKFCNLIIKFGPDNCPAYCFNSAGLELMEFLNDSGTASVLEQTIAPKAIEIKLVQSEREANPDWEPQDHIENHLVDAYCAREAAEWESAKLVLCGSEFVRQSIIDAGGPANKCRVVPYGVDSSHCSNTPRVFESNRRLRVLTVGRACIRKGTHTLMQVAKNLKKVAEFRLVGPLSIDPKMVDKLSNVVDVVGRVPRSDMDSHYQWADLFFLPSVCEGSATVTYEAATRGIPIVCTPNTGSLVRNGFDGMLVDYRNVEEMTEIIAELSASPDLLPTLSRNALTRFKEYSLEGYRERLLEATSQI